MTATKSVHPGMSRLIAAEWEAPIDLFRELDQEFHFTLDACARPHNAKCKKFFTPDVDGLKQDWRGEVVWCFPPSGSRAFRLWVEKAAKEAKKKNTKVVMLLPVSTDAKWFHTHIYKQNGVRIRFLPERVKFTNQMLPSWAANGSPVKKACGGMRPSMIVIFDGSKRKFAVE